MIIIVLLNYSKYINRYSDNKDQNKKKEYEEMKEQTEKCYIELSNLKNDKYTNPSKKYYQDLEIQNIDNQEFRHYIHM